MNETLIRLFSGVVYALLLLAAILVSHYSFTGLVFVFGVITLFELQELLSLKSYLAYGLLVVFMAFFSVFHYLDFDYIIYLFVVFTLIVDVLLIKDLLVIREIPLFEERKYLMVIFYLIGSLVFLTLIPYQNQTNQYNPDVLIGIFVLIWVNDSFAYLIGKTFGRRKLFERISPNKTVGGFIGGLLFCLLAGYVVYHYSQTLSAVIWIAVALIASVFGTFGDLIQSKLKRQAGVKDSGSLMPGHGGLLDRLDSILFASTFIYSFLVIVNHVS